MRILILNWRDLAHPHAGGAEVYTHEVARRWVAAGHVVTWFAGAAPPAAEQEIVDGVHVVRRGGRHGLYRAGRRFIASNRGRFDLIIDEVNTRPFGTPRCAGPTPSVALIHQVCREIWFHEMPWLLAAAGRFVVEPRWLAPYRDWPVLTVSESSRASLAQYGLRNIIVVPEGVAPTARPAVERAEAPTLLYVGRLASNKRPDHAVAAYDIARRSCPDLRMWVIGEGPMRAELERAAGPGITFYGRVDDEQKRELMARAHLLVTTSVREGWGLVVDEAAAMGTPTIGYDVPGLCDSIAAAGGLLCPPTPQALADAISGRIADEVANPRSHGWAGGAQDWDVVAPQVLRAACAAAGIPPTPHNRMDPPS